MGTVLTASFSLLLSTQTVEGKPDPNTLLVETDEGSAKGKDYGNFIGVNHGGATRVSSGWGGDINSIGVNTGSAAQFSDYKDQSSDYFNTIGINPGVATQFSSGFGGVNHIGVNTGHAVQHSDYNDKAEDYFNQIGTVGRDAYQYKTEHHGPTVNGPVKGFQQNMGGSMGQVQNIAK